MSTRSHPRTTTDTGDSGTRSRPPQLMLQTWVGIQPAWAVSSYFWPDAGLAVYACFPVGLGIAFAARRFSWVATPTALSLIVATLMSMIVDTAGAESIAGAAMTLLYFAGEIKARALRLASTLSDALSERIAHKVRGDLLSHTPSIASDAGAEPPPPPRPRSTP